MELTEMERRKRFERFFELSGKIIKKGLLYIPTKELDLGADIIKMEEIISESTPYAERMKKSARYTMQDIIKLRKFMDRYNSDTFFTAIPLSVSILLKELGKMRDIYMIAINDGESPDRSRNWFHGKSKTFYMISNMIKDDIIVIKEIEEKAVHGGTFKTRLITNINIPIGLLEKEQKTQEMIEAEIEKDKHEEEKDKHEEMRKKFNIPEDITQPLEQPLEKVDQTEKTEEEKDKQGILEDLKNKIPISDIATKWGLPEEEVHTLFIQSLKR